MNAPTPHAHLAQREPETAIVTMGFGSLASFEFMQRTARMFAASSMVPTAYRAQVLKKEKNINGDWVEAWEENLSAIPNCVIALNMSQRMNADPLMIMQNLHVIEGRPSWSSQFIIAAINSCGRYSPLRFDIVMGEEIDATHTTFEGWGKNKKVIVNKVRVKNATCIAWAVELATKTRLESPMVSMEMAVNEGWYGKNGSKWQSMPDLMLRYRSAAFFGRIYAPELLMGLPSAEESHDVVMVTEQADGSYAADPTAKADRAPAAAPSRTANAEDAEVKTATYPDDQFKKSLPIWLAAIAQGKRTVEQIITMAQSKFPLTDAQKAQIDPPTTSPVGEPDADGVIQPIQPAKTFDEVMALVCAAQTMDELYLTDALIDAITDPDEKAILAGKFDERADALRNAA